MKPLEAVARVFEIIQVGYWPVEEGVPSQSFGIGEQALNIRGGENLLEFNSLISFLHSYDSEILRSFSRKPFLDRFIGFIAPKKRGDILPVEDEVKAFFAELRQIELKKFKVLRDIRGVVLSDPTKIFCLGNFKIFHFKSHRDHYEKLLGNSFQIMCLPHEPEYLIEYEVESREQSRAIEIADEYFKKFVLFLRHIIGTSDERFEVGILDYMGWRGRSAHVLCGDQYSGKVENYGSFEPIPIDDPYFSNTESGYNRLWNLIDTNNLNKLEKRITTAVAWVGRSLLEQTVQTAFIEASIALESIFTYSEKSIINPSILNQITESVALLLGNNVEQRIALEKQIKSLYSIRSGIVHAGDKEVAREDYNLFIQYIRMVIAKLLVDEQFTSCSNVEDLYKTLKIQKYT